MELQVNSPCCRRLSCWMQSSRRPFASCIIVVLPVPVRRPRRSRLPPAVGALLLVPPGALGGLFMRRSRGAPRRRQGACTSIPAPVLRPSATRPLQRIVPGTPWHCARAGGRTAAQSVRPSRAAGPPTSSTAPCHRPCMLHHRRICHGRRSLPRRTWRATPPEFSSTMTMLCSMYLPLLRPAPARHPTHTLARTGYGRLAR